MTKANYRWVPDIVNVLLLPVVLLCALPAVAQEPCTQSEAIKVIRDGTVNENAGSDVSTDGNVSSEENGDKGQTLDESYAVSQKDTVADTEFNESKSPTVDKTAEAQRLFESGKKLFEAGEYEAAISAFEKAQQLKPHPAVKTNIGLCYEKMGDLARAYAVYTQSLENDADFTAPSWMKEHISELRGKVVVLTVECPRDGCRIIVDGMEQKTSPSKVFLMPGEHVAEAYDGKEVFARVSRYLRAGETSHIALVAPETSAPKVTPLPPKPKVEIPPRKPVANTGKLPFSNAFWVGAGVTAGAGIVTIIFGIQTLRDKDHWTSDSNPDTDLKKSGERHRLLTNVMLGVTVAAAATTTVIAVYGLRKKKKMASPSVSAAVAPLPYILLEGQF
ncbi:MAG: hypothetical protein JXR76_10075 [Deltaproteobacteria bacterium]|nr:hypothetical protein [Deltaproteobacteria bacterium]